MDGSVSGRSGTNRLDLDLVDEHDEEIIFETRTTNISFESAGRNSVGQRIEPPFKMDSVEGIKDEGKERPEVRACESRNKSSA